MTVTFYWYPNCGTCKKAKKWLDDEEVDYNTIHIVEAPPSQAQLKSFVDQSKLPVRKFFNTSGKKYRELNMKDKLKDASETDMIEWLASDGMLLKRPIVTDGNHVTIGFKAEQFNETWSK